MCSRDGRKKTMCGHILCFRKSRQSEGVNNSLDMLNKCCNGQNTGADTTFSPKYLRKSIGSPVPQPPTKVLKTNNGLQLKLVRTTC